MYVANPLFGVKTKQGMFNEPVNDEQKGRMAKSGSESVSDKADSKSDSSRSGSGSRSGSESDSWNSNSSDSESDLRGSPPPPSKRPGQRNVMLKKKKPVRRRNNYSSDEEETSEGSDDEGRSNREKQEGFWHISQKAWYGLGHVYNDLCAAMWFSYILLFFQVVLAMEPIAAGAMLFLGQVVDALATPVVGILTDRCISKKMWHLTGTTLVTCTFPFLFIRCWGCKASEGAENEYLKWWMLLYYATLITFFQVGWAAVQISHLAMIPSITDCLQTRNELTSIRYTASVCSSIAVYLITWSVLKATDYSRYIGPDDDYKFKNVSLIITAIGVVCATLFHVGFRLKDSKASTEDKTAKDNLQNGKVDEGSIITDKIPPIQSKIIYFLKKPFLYHASLLYVFSRLYWALTLVYVPLFLEERLTFNLEEGSETVASVPLVLYIASFFSSLALKYRVSSCGNQLAYLSGSCLSLISSLWIALFISPEASTFQIYSVAALMGAGSSITMVASLCITADLIGPHSHQGAAVYSIVTFADKLVTGVAVVVIENFKCLNPEDCPQYYRGVLTYACGGCALLGLLSLAVARATLRRSA